MPTNLLAALLFAGGVAGRSLADFPMDVRKRNMLQLSREPCDDCVTMEEFYQNHELGFVLFYEHALVSTHKYKSSIIAGFHDTCAELRWSRVACGQVDMIVDREYAERYIDPQTAPAHILIRDGEPLPLQKHHLDRLMAKPGDKATMLWHIRDVLAPSDPLALDLSFEAAEASALSQVLKRHEVVLVVGASTGREEREAVRAAAQRLLLNGSIPFVIKLPGHVGHDADADPPKKGVRRWRKARERRRLAIVVAHGAKTLRAQNLQEGVAVAFIAGKPLVSPQPAADLVGSTERRWRQPTASNALSELVDAALAAISHKQTSSGAGEGKSRRGAGEL